MCPYKPSLKRRASDVSTQAPSGSGSAADSDSNAESRSSVSPSPKRCRRESPTGLQAVGEVLHQFGLVGEPHYDSRQTRLWQLLERLPWVAAEQRTMPALIVAEPAAVPGIQALVNQMREALFPDDAEALNVTVLSGRNPRLPSDAKYSLVINHEPPRTGQEYMRRLAALAPAAERGSAATAVAPGVVYTMLQERQLANGGVREVVNLLQRAKRSMRARGRRIQVSELDSALQIISSTDTSDDYGDDDDEGGDDCDCVCCRSQSMSCISFHAMQCSGPRVEVVRVQLEALDNLSRVSPMIAPRLRDHACTIICLHSLFCHTPWDGAESYFALPAGMGSVRVVMVLATDCSWHDYPDCGTFSGGVAWTDILDTDSMNATDATLAKLEEHEIKLLGGDSRRLVLMGISQGGGQAMYRFLRSRNHLGGYIGAVCHVPVAPHVPRSCDPLAIAKQQGKALTNQDRPVRMLAGELDTTFPAPLVLRDAERLRKDGGFLDVEVTVQKGLTHEGDEGCGVQADLKFLRKHLPQMLPRAPIAGDAAKLK